MINDIYFISDNLKLFGRLCLPKTFKVGVVFLHGGGQSNALRYEFLQSEFEKNNITSLAFDFRGCGKSEGNFEDGSLKNREVDAKNAINYFIKKSKLNIDQIYIWGSSMGGHVACKLTQEFNFKGIILQSAAAYSLESENVKLNEEFTKLITKENNWTDSPAFKALTDFKNKKLVVYGQNDDVIPEGVKNKYKSILSANDKYTEIEKVGHKLLRPDNKDEIIALEKLAIVGIEFIQ